MLPRRRRHARLTRSSAFLETGHHGLFISKDETRRDALPKDASRSVGGHALTAKTAGMKYVLTASEASRRGRARARVRRSCVGARVDGRLRGGLRGGGRDGRGCVLLTAAVAHEQQNGDAQGGEGDDGECAGHAVGEGEVAGSTDHSVIATIGAQDNDTDEHEEQGGTGETQRDEVEEAAVGTGRRKALEYVDAHHAEQEHECDRGHGRAATEIAKGANHGCTSAGVRGLTRVLTVGLAMGCRRTRL